MGDGRTNVAPGREKGDRENFFISVSANIIASSVVIAAFSAMSEGESGRRRAPVWQRPNIKIGSTEEREKRRGGRKRGKAIASGMGVRTELREGGETRIRGNAGDACRPDEGKKEEME